LADFANARFEIAIFSKLHLFRSVQESEVSVKIRQNYYCLRFGLPEMRLNSALDSLSVLQLVDKL